MTILCTSMFEEDWFEVLVRPDEILDQNKKKEPAMSLKELFESMFLFEKQEAKRHCFIR